MTLGPEYFDAFYREHGDDPWGFADRWYEQRKRAVLMASLPRPRFTRAFEPGCSVGMLTEQLAHRCDEVLAIDVSARAVGHARERTAHLPGVRVERASMVVDWPDGSFDLIVLSEVGYYLGLEDLRALVNRLAATLAGDGVLVACHWRHPVDEYPLDGDTVHEELGREPRLGLLARHVEEDFVLDVLTAAPTVSVARATGVLG